MGEINRLIEKIKKLFMGFIEKQSLSERDKRAVKIAGAALGVFVAFLILKAVMGGGTNDQQKLTELKDRLHEVKQLRVEYDYANNLLRQLTSSIQKEDEALISVVEKILVDNQIDRKSFSIKDSNITTAGTDDLYEEKSVQVDIKRITIQKFIDVLYTIQNRKSFLKVSDLKLKSKFDKENQLDVSFRLSTFEFNQVL